MTLGTLILFSATKILEFGVKVDDGLGGLF